MRIIPPVFVTLLWTMFFQANAWPDPREPVLLGRARQPLAFEANQGQTDAEARFLARGPGYLLYLTPRGAVLTWREGFPDRGVPPERPAGHAAIANKAAPGGRVLRLMFEGADPADRISGLDELPGKSHYFVGRDPAKWLSNIPLYARVRYEEVYPGIDVLFYGHQGELEFDFVLRPGARPEAIRLAFTGADALRLDRDGHLVLRVGADTLLLRAPIVYQRLEGEIPSRYVLMDGDRLAFELGPYRADEALVLDPLLQFSTYMGRSQRDVGTGVAVDGQGNIYVSGYTDSVDFPTTVGAFQAIKSVSLDAFVMKLAPEGFPILYSTFLGGSSEDRALDIKADATGNSFVVGKTFSSDFPVMNAAQSLFGGTADVFVAKLNAAGSGLVYSTYVGGSGEEEARRIAADANGSAYVAGTTSSVNFPVVNARQMVSGGGDDAFVVKLSPAGSSRVYATYLGGLGDEFGNGIDVDASGNAYVTGFTDSLNFPLASARDSLLGGDSDAFVTKYNAAGTAYLYSTYLGGTGAESGIDIAADAAGNAYVTGDTDSTDFPTMNPVQASFGGGGAFFGDAFVTKLNAAGSALVYSTYLGGTQGDAGFGITIDQFSAAYVTGLAVSSNFPTVDAIQSLFGGTTHSFYGDAFVAKVSAAGSSLLFSTYLGGSSEDFGHGIAVDASGIAYVTGSTASPNFPRLLALQNSYGGSPSPLDGDAFIAKLFLAPTPSLTLQDDIVSWPSLQGAIGYDIVVGDLRTLRQTGGDFAQATVRCLADDLPAISIAFPDMPLPREGFWIVARAVFSDHAGTYDSGSPFQADTRDIQLTGAPLSCP